MIIQIKAYMIACAPVSVCHRCRAHVQSLSRAQRFVIPWTGAHQAPLPMEFSRQEYYRLPFPTPGDLPDPGIKSISCFSCDEENTHTHTHTHTHKAPVGAKINSIQRQSQLKSQQVILWISSNDSKDYTQIIQNSQHIEKHSWRTNVTQFQD